MRGGNVKEGQQYLCRMGGDPSTVDQRSRKPENSHVQVDICIIGGETSTKSA